MIDEFKENYVKLIEKGILPFLRCSNCDYNTFYIRNYCPKCSSRLEVKESSGIGKIFSLTEFQGKEGVVVYAIVEMKEGFRMYANVAGKVKPGEEVKVFFTEKNGKKVPMFYKVI
jgi:uncharacterized OB-fold protein